MDDLAESLDRAVRRCDAPHMGGRLVSSAGTLVGLAVILGTLAVVASALGIVLVVVSEQDDALREVGKWSLQVALVFAGTGVVSVVVRQSELSRARRDLWEERLHQLIGAHDTAHTAARLLSAHATAKTYSEQVEVIAGVREILRRLSSAPGIHDKDTLSRALLKMRE
jgi:hypothetical protein